LRSKGATPPSARVAKEVINDAMAADPVADALPLNWAPVRKPRQIRTGYKRIFSVNGLIYMAFSPENRGFGARIANPGCSIVASDVR
jgi:hypothetical protein